MDWINMDYLSYQEFERINNETIRICKEYDVRLPDVLYINKRLRATDGMFVVCHDDNDPNCIETGIDLAYNHLKKFGIDSLLRVLYHELAHHIRYEMYQDMEHNDEFNELCYELGGHLDTQHYDKNEKYTCLKYEGIETPDKWEYTCICGNVIRTKRKLKMDTRGCIHCDIHYCCLKSKN